jgi:hypothetical protein
MAASLGVSQCRARGSEELVGELVSSQRTAVQSL